MKNEKMKNVMFAHVDIFVYEMWAFLYFPVIFKGYLMGIMRNFFKKNLKKCLVLYTWYSLRPQAFLEHFSFNKRQGDSLGGFSPFFVIPHGYDGRKMILFYLFPQCSIYV